MDRFAAGYGRVIDALGHLLFVLAVVLAVVALVDWLARTRRINPFNPLARFFRSTVDPLLVPIERRVIRAGGMPSSAPWWALAAVVLGGIILLSLLRFLGAQVAGAASLASRGPRGLYVLLVTWTVSLLQIALLVRVVSSWLRISPYSPWIRWAVRLTEPILRPLRQFIPPLGMVDVTPIVAYFGLVLLEWVFLRLAV